MVRTLLEELAEVQQKVPFIGYQILDIITSGMYDDPLMVYREYIQNAVDAIDIAVQEGEFHLGEGRISILISGLNRSVSIQDNGVGLAEANAKRVLLDLGCSPKDGSGQRGFRGIGRLGGLAYCDLLRFETRSSDEKHVTIVEWNKKRLDDLTNQINRKTSLVEIVKNITQIFTRKANEQDPQHYFRVQMENVQKFHSDKLMNTKMIKEYLSQVAPVPYDTAKFSFAERLDKYFSVISGYKEYNITINGEKILRPYSNRFQISDGVTDEIGNIECFEFSTTDGKPLALGWYAKTNFKASLPSQVTMRGIRVRHGNLEVGDEYFLSPFFNERRFATWNIGEIQLYDHKIRPNARRDGFEQTSEYERFLEQASLLGRRLSTFCRRYSSERSLKQKVENKLEVIEQLLNKSYLFIDKDHRENLINMVREELDKLSPIIKNKNFQENAFYKYEEVESKLKQLEETSFFIDKYLDGRSLRHIDKREIVQKLIRLVLNEYDKSSSAYDLIQKVLTPFLKPVVKKNLNSIHQDYQKD
jgi:molecular chaperone HtpG